MDHTNFPKQNIGSIDQLRQLQIRLKRFSATQGDPDFEFVIPELSLDVNREMGRLMNAWKGECGCTAGGLATGTAVLIAIGYGLLRFRELEAVRLAILFGLIVFCALFGKVFGLLWTRARMVVSVRRALQSIQPPDGLVYHEGGSHG